MNDELKNDGQTEAHFNRRAEDMTASVQKVQQMMILFEDPEFVNVAQKLTTITNVDEAVAAITEANKRLVANLDPDTAALFTTAMAQGVIDRNIPQPFDSLQAATTDHKPEDALKMAEGWSQQTQQSYLDALKGNNIKIEPKAPPVQPLPKV
jgi:hypothetical protein